MDNGIISFFLFVYKSLFLISVSFTSRFLITAFPNPGAMDQNQSMGCLVQGRTETINNLCSVFFYYLSLKDVFIVRNGRLALLYVLT